VRHCTASHRCQSDERGTTADERGTRPGLAAEDAFAIEACWHVRTSRYLLPVARVAMVHDFRAIALLTALLSTSCIAVPAPALPQNMLKGAYCGPSLGLESRASRSPPEGSDARAPHAAARGFSAGTLDIARAIGALDQMERLVEAEDRGAPEGEIAYLRGQLNDTIAAAALDLSSIAANIQCEEWRAREVASWLHDAESKQVRKLTAASLVLSATAAIAAGVLAVADGKAVPAAAVGIGGGIIAGTLGFTTLSVHATTPYLHPRNLLGQVWRGEAHPDFPETVWAYLTRPALGDAHNTPREYVVGTWTESGRLGDDPAHPASERVALFFGEGGTYDANGLFARAGMLGELAQTVSLMSHDLQHLARAAAE
jgi:hypothetical protein